MAGAIDVISGITIHRNKRISLMLRAFIGCSVIFLYGCIIVPYPKGTECHEYKNQLDIIEIATDTEYKPETNERLVIGKYLVTRDGEMLPHEKGDLAVTVGQLEGKLAPLSIDLSPDMNEPFLWVVPPGKYIIAFIKIAFVVDKRFGGRHRIFADSVFDVPKGPGITYIGTLHISLDKREESVTHEIIDESSSVLTTHLSESRDLEFDIALMKYDSNSDFLPSESVCVDGSTDWGACYFFVTGGADCGDI